MECKDCPAYLNICEVEDDDYCCQEFQKNLADNFFRNDSIPEDPDRLVDEYFSKYPSKAIKLTKKGGAMKSHGKSISQREI